MPEADRTSSMDDQERITAAAAGELRVSARYLGERIDTRAVKGYDVAAPSPLLLRVRDGGWVVLLRYGVMVSFGMTRAEEEVFLAGLAQHVSRPYQRVETEEVLAHVDPTHGEGIDAAGALWLRDTDPGRLAVVAEVLAKSTALAHYEREVGDVFGRLEPHVEGVRQGREGRGHRRLLVQLGEALKTQARVTGRVEVTEKPELTWDDPVLDRLYERLSAEFELEERDQVLTRKTGFLSESAGLLIDMARQRQTLRVEWYIVILILIEIVILVVDLARR